MALHVHVYIHTCTIMYIHTCVIPCSRSSLGALGRHWRLERANTTQSILSQIFDLFTCNSENHINIDSWLDILPSQAFIIMLFQCSFQVHSTYECLICVDIEAYCMCFWAIKSSLHITVYVTLHQLAQPEGALESIYCYQKHSTVCGGRTHFKWHACHRLGKGGSRKLPP